MKKVAVILIAVAMTVCLMAGCGEKAEKVTPDISPYDTLNYEEYVELPDYMSFEFQAQKTEVTDEDVQAEIDSRLQAASTETKEVTEGTVQQGDTVRISFKGTLEDGSSPEGMNSDGYDLTLGEASMIDGFQEGLYGATIGEPVTLNLQFPDPYTMNEELSGKPVTFEVTVLHKLETVMKELDEEFIKESSEGNAANEEEFREYIKNYLQEQADENALFNAKTDLYQQIVAPANVLKRPDGEVEALTESLKVQYKDYVESNGANWEEYLEAIGGEEAYEEGIAQLAENQINNKVVVFGLCNKEGLELSDEEFTEELMKYVESAGGESIKDFEEKSGMTIQGFIDMYDLDAEIYLTKVLDKIYAEKYPES